ncbi:MAG: Hsp20/alpha crystallin family protein [Nitrospira sp.]|nr:Hsp20/alpha crystallin family protein [bacterium]MBL7049238.1 Hsp20/alpha crystallin family protein [Nitrospira sp.]
MEAVKEIQKKEADSKEGIERTRAKKLYAPPVDIIEDEKGLTLIADMPGVNEGSVEITLEKNILTIYGAVEPEVHDSYRLVSAEYGLGDYQRTFTLSDEIDRDKILATVKNGVLRLVLPKSESAKTRKIPVKAE